MMSKGARNSLPLDYKEEWSDGSRDGPPDLASARLASPSTLRPSETLELPESEPAQVEAVIGG